MAADEEPRPDDDIRRLRMQDGRVALVRIRHRLQKIQDEMDALKRKQQESDRRRAKSKDR
jgi:hypothetical protein